MVHIKLITIKRQLQQKMHYPLEPDPLGEYRTLDEAFDELLYSFRLYANRNKLYSFTAVSDAIERQSMTEKMADVFTDYIIKGWRVI